MKDPINSIHPVSLKFADPLTERDFQSYYISKYLWQLRLAHILAAIFFFMAVFSEMTFISNHGFSTSLRIFIVVPSFIIGLAITYFAKDFYKKYYTYFNVYYVLLTGLSFIVSGAYMSATPYSYMFYIGIMISLIFNYTFIKQDFIKASATGAILIFTFFITVFFYNHSFNYLVHISMYILVCNMLGMFIAYSIEYDGRRNYALMRKINEDAHLVAETNFMLEQKIKERTSELETAKLKSEESEQYLKSVIDNIGDPVFVKDDQSRLLVVNESFCRLFDLPLESIIGKTLAEDVAPDERESFFQIDRQVLADGVDNINEETLTVRDKETLTISTRKTRFIDKKGNKYLIGTIRDITDRKMMEMELMQQKERAEESDRLKSAFLANMSHEIRTPMNGILGFANLLNESGLERKDQKTYIDIINKSGQRLLNLINDIISISKIESGIIENQIVEVDIHKQLDFVFHLFASDAEQRGLRFFLDKSTNIPQVFFTDPDKLFAIVSNLVKNAIKFTDNGEVVFGNELIDGQTLLFYVKDTGIGIPKDRYNAIFERFIQADLADKMARQGAGLGLTIAKSYVESLGGEIWFESEENKGTCFYFTLKSMVPPESDSAKKSHSMVQNEEIHDEATCRCTVLIAEDDEASVMYATNVVEKIANTIYFADSGNETVSMVRQHPEIEVVLMDIQMPDGNGYEATQLIREFNQDVIIIAQTAFAMAGDKEKALEAGCNDYVSKPLKKEKLIAIIQQLVCEKRNQA